MGEATMGERVAKLREARGLTGVQLAHALGLTKQQVSKIESGARKVDVSEVAEIADVLGVTVGELLGTARSRSLGLAARVMTMPTDGADVDARRRLRQFLEADSVLAATCGLRPSVPSPAGAQVFERARSDELDRAGGSASRAGERLAEVVRAELGLGRAPVADIAELAEAHFGLDVGVWPVGGTVSGLCAHGDDIAMVLVSSSFSAGHERFTAAHEVAHHLLGDPREVVIETNLYDTSTPAEVRANAFAAALLLPPDGVRESVLGRPVDAEVLGGLLRHFKVSYQALIHRLRALRVLSPTDAERWLADTPTRVLRAAGDSNPRQLTDPTVARRVPTRLWRAALDGYQTGKVGIGVLAGLVDSDAEDLYGQLVADGIVPPAVVDELADV
jgi:transcriptional regulator with XRE-family HTH domain/Zn-dependent peptidase ImmA (M78 family)